MSQSGIGNQDRAKSFVAWGKLNESGKSHPLTAHMLDVAACFRAVSELKSIRRAMECVAGRKLTPLDVSRLSALAFLHDIGKANAGFQAKRWARDGLAIPSGWPETAGHTTEALFIFTDQTLLSAMPVSEMSAWGGTCINLWRGMS